MSSSLLLVLWGANPVRTFVFSWPLSLSSPRLPFLLHSITKTGRSPLPVALLSNFLISRMCGFSALTKSHVDRFGCRHGIQPEPMCCAGGRPFWVNLCSKRVSKVLWFTSAGISFMQLSRKHIASIRSLLTARSAHCELRKKPCGPQKVTSIARDRPEMEMKQPNLWRCTIQKQVFVNDNVPFVTWVSLVPVLWCCWTSSFSQFRWANSVGSFVLYSCFSFYEAMTCFEFNWVYNFFAPESSMEDVADLQLQWQRAIRLQDQVGTALLEAWASTSAANEILETFTNQGLLQETTDHPPYL